MKKFTKILCIVLAVFVSLTAVSLVAFSAGKKTINSGSKKPSSSAGDSGQSSVVALTDEELFVYYASQLNDSNTSRIFTDWYTRTDKSGKTKYQLLETFFSMLAYHNDTTHTVRFYSPSNSNYAGETGGTPLDDLAGKKAQSLYTDSGEVDDSNEWIDLQGNARTDGEDWASENRLTWYIRANALSLESGEMNVIAIEGIDSAFDITGENAPVYTFQLSPWFKEVDDGLYLTKSWRANYAAGYAPFNDNIGLDGNARIMTWHASFGGGYTTYDSRLTSGAYRDPATFTSATDGDTAAKKWNSYEGVGADANAKWALYEWQHRHFNLENSGIADGCVDYNYQVTVAVEETGVKRVLLSQEDASDFVVGSNVYVGDANQNRNTNQKSYVDNGDDGVKEDFKKDGTRAGAPDRSNAQSRNVSDGFAKILSKTTVNVGGTNYIALNLELSETIYNKKNNKF